MPVRLIVPKKHYSVVSGAPIGSVADALKIASSMKVARNEFALYRGHSEAKWHLRPAVFRNARWYRHERDMVRELISTHPQEFTGDSLMLDRLVRMQHYGLPTRLLDVTQNFLVALYFACESTNSDDDGEVFVIKGETHLKKYYDSDAVSLVSNLSNLSEKEKKDLWSASPENEAEPENDAFNSFPAVDRLLQFVRNEKPYFRSMAQKADLKSTFFVIPKKNNRRIIAQSGAFLVFGLVDETRSPDLSMFEITSHRVPHSGKETICKELQALGITLGNLFPEIDRAANHIAATYRTS